jgi:predicted amidohydrolase YtcJ
MKLIKVFLFLVMKTLFYNARVWLKDNDFAEAVGFDSISGRIIFTGKNINADKKYFDEAIDIDKKLILPAFTDGHMHLIRGSLMKSEVDLSSASTIQDFRNQIISFRKNLKKNNWITGGFFSETNFKEKFSVDKYLLDAICPDIPIAISRIDLHSFAVNSLTIELTGIKSMIGKFGNDEIICDADGELTGELKERAMYYVLDKIPKIPEIEIESAVTKEVNRLFSLGITSISDIFWKDYFDTYMYLLSGGKLPLKINAIIPIEDFNIIDKYKDAFRQFENSFKINSFKTFYDGSLSSEAAYFEKNYIGKNYNGLRTEIINTGEFDKLALEVDRAGYQIAVHSIGDKAVSELLDFVELLIKKNGIRDRRFRIEHAQHIKLSDIPRFKKLNVVTSVQPSHLYVDAKTATEKLPEPNTTHIYKRIIEEGAVVCFGTDFPVASENPFETIYYAMTREANGFPDGFNTEYCLDLINCLKAYTINNAYTSYEEDKRGKIALNYSADLIVLKNDLFRINKKDIKYAEVKMTYLNGSRVY